MLTYVNEYQMAQSVYILYGDSRTWLEAITKAQVHFQKFRFTLFFCDCKIIQQHPVAFRTRFAFFMNLLNVVFPSLFLSVSRIT